MDENQKAILRSMTLLYIEDHTKTTNDIEKIFSTFFRKILVASNGKEALEIYQNNHIDIIITDINMPKMDGLTMIETIRKTNKKISIIILTAYADRDLLFKATNLQIDGYLTKPINFTKIISALENALARMEVFPLIQLSQNLQYDLHSMQLLYDGELVLLGQKENQFIAYLLKNKNKIITKEELMANVWTHEYPSESAFKNLIYSIRKKLGKEAIENIQGIGWKINTL